MTVGLLDTSVFVATESGRRKEINDSWIAAMAIAHGYALITQDREFPTDVGGLTVI